MVLEALGNARTANNTNSSRFGKYLELGLTPAGDICGATFRCFLLEKSRVARQAAPERNFHVFYQLLAAVDSPAAAMAGGRAALETLKLRGAADHAITRAGAAVGDAAGLGALADAPNFAALVEALRGAEASVGPLLGALAAVLHLGDITFEGDERGCTSVSAAPLAAAAEALGVDAAVLRERLTEKLIGVVEVVTVPLPPEGAALARDAVAKGLYLRLFSFYTKCLNLLLREDTASAGGGGDSSRGGGRTVGLLDVFGFESLATKSLEQLCINFANEKLHALFLSHVFKETPAALLKALLGADASGIDNRPCVALVEAPPNGILHLLDHQCRAPNASEQSFCAAVNEAHGENAFLTVPKLSKACAVDARSGFIVRHYAGDVLYSAGAFIEINNDTLPDTRWLQAATAPFVSHLFTDPSLQPPQPKRGTFASVAQRFSADLTRLLRTLQATDAHFIRCVKPNLQMRPRAFDARYVRSRLRAAGSLGALRFLKKVQGTACVALRTLERLRRPPHAAALPPTLRDDAMPAAEWAAALLDTVGVPSTLYRIVDGSITLCTALVPWLTAMEDEGASADAAAADAVRRALAPLPQQSGAARRRDEVAAKLDAVRSLTAAIAAPKAATVAATAPPGTARTDAIRAAADGVARSGAPALSGTRTGSAAGTAAASRRHRRRHRRQWSTHSSSTCSAATMTTTSAISSAASDTPAAGADAEAAASLSSSPRPPRRPKPPSAAPPPLPPRSTPSSSARHRPPERVSARRAWDACG